MRIDEAIHQGWTGEAEGLKVSLAAAEHKLSQMDQIAARRNTTVALGMPTFAEAAGRTVTVTDHPNPGEKTTCPPPQ